MRCPPTDLRQAPLASKRLRYALVLIVENGWKRSQQMRRQDGSLAFR